MEESKPTCTPSSPSQKQKLKLKYPFCLPSPFRKTNYNHHSLPASPHADKPSRLLRTSSSSSSFTSTWIKSRAHDIPDIKDKCKNFISRIGRNGNANGQAHGHGHGHGHGRGHRRRHSMSADFHYDAMSYALNFDEGHDGSPKNEFPLRSFSSRLPQSPKREIECS
ncbi:hypothetical protein P3X46_031662 [Hevea brasiliensis]|uniref:Uncharacterized protein n=1 Tax=Hevea brasiliensis TaxID=3981 RepID=A0ABQ9KMA8_HEVBR|nr:uncharacterized protein LOC110635147 [Hevea brasiliensis]KAJ9141085.1 hypothetical protein P3X46_031662 [Hevea brasiliensis]